MAVSTIKIKNEEISLTEKELQEIYNQIDVNYWWKIHDIQSDPDFNSNDKHTLDSDHDIELYNWWFDENFIKPEKWCLVCLKEID